MEKLNFSEKASFWKYKGYRCESMSHLKLCTYHEIFLLYRVCTSRCLSLCSCSSSRSGDNHYSYSCTGLTVYSSQPGIFMYRTHSVHCTVPSQVYSCTGISVYNSQPGMFMYKTYSVQFLARYIHVQDLQCTVPSQLYLYSSLTVQSSQPDKFKYRITPY